MINECNRLLTAEVNDAKIKSWFQNRRLGKTGPKSETFENKKEDSEPDEEFSDEDQSEETSYLISKKPRKRIIWPIKCLEILEAAYGKDQYLEPGDRSRLAIECNQIQGDDENQTVKITERHVKNWFRNRRSGLNGPKSEIGPVPSESEAESETEIELNLSDDDNDADKETDPVDCPECRAVISNLSQLYSHLRVVHGRTKWLHYRTKKIEKVQEYQCKDCYFYFSNERYHTCEKYKSILFKLTEQKEVEDIPATAICPYCPKTETSEETGLEYDVSYDYETLIEHIRKAHQYSMIDFRSTKCPIQPIECKNCGFFHNSKKDLKKHHHANAQNGRCKRNRNIIKKYREKELKDNDGKADKGEEDEIILLNGGIRRKTLRPENLIKKVPIVSACPECDEKFSTFIEMDSHFRTSHDREKYTTFRRLKRDEDKEFCDICQFHFPTQEAVFSHFEFCREYQVENTDNQSGGGGSRRKSKRAKASLAEEDLAGITSDEKKKIENEKRKIEFSKGIKRKRNSSVDNKILPGSSLRNLGPPINPSGVARNAPGVAITETSKSYEVLIQPEAQSQFQQIWLPVQQGFRLVEISPSQGINQITIPNQPQIINLTNQNQTQIINLPGQVRWNKPHVKSNITSRGTSGSTITSGTTSGSTILSEQSVDVKTEVGTDDNIVSIMENDSQPIKTPISNTKKASMKKVKELISEIITRPAKEKTLAKLSRSKVGSSSPVSSSSAVSEISSRASSNQTGEIADLTDFTIAMGEESEIVENETQFHYDLKAATYGNLNKALHKRVLENEKFRCMLKSCKYTAPFKDMLDHLRKKHCDAYVVYRFKMMEKYGIMEMSCPSCNFQFLTTYSYEHHRKNKRCHVYKDIEIPASEEEKKVIDSMRTTLELV